MRVNPTVKALQNSVLKGAAGKRPAEALSRGVETAALMSSSATEFLRVRRDPAEVAIRRRRAAVRRANIWGAGSLVSGIGTAAMVVGVVDDGITASAIFSLVLVAAILTWCLFGLTRAVKDLRRRSREVAALPPPQPARRPVASTIRSDIGRLDSYSDGLRQVVSMLPVDSPDQSSLRRDVIVSADGAEMLLRRQAQEYTGLRKTSAGAPARRRGQDSPRLRTNWPPAFGSVLRSTGAWSQPPRRPSWPPHNWTGPWSTCRNPPSGCRPWRWGCGRSRNTPGRPVPDFSLRRSAGSAAGRSPVASDSMRLTEFRALMTAHFGSHRASAVAADHVFSALDGRTVDQALAAGENPKTVWAVVCETFDVPAALHHGLPD